MKNVVLLFSLMFSNCGKKHPQGLLATEQVPDHIIAAQKLQQFCGSCHGLGKLRFLRSDKDDENWKYIFTHQVPKKEILWSESIVDVLNWPTKENPPPFDQPKNPDTGADWMPKGFARLQLHNDQVNGQSTREFILQQMRTGRL